MVSVIWGHLCLVLVFTRHSNYASANSEGDALSKFKSNLADPLGVMSSWDATMINPCTWYNVSCNSDYSVIGIDLGNANLSGQLVRELDQLANLQFLELFSNNISGEIPYELGNLTNLESLNLYLNNLTGPVPDTLGNLSRLRTLRLNNNSLSGEIPRSLTAVTTLKVVDLSYNQLSGTVPVNGSFAFFTPVSFNGNHNLTLPAGVHTSPVSSQAGVMSIGKEILPCTKWLNYLSIVGLLCFGLAGF